MADLYDLKKLCNEIFTEMAAFNSAMENESYGFHFTYSREGSWKPNIKVLFLTLNPQSSDGRGRSRNIIPSVPWPKENEFLQENNKFNIKNNILLILSEIAKVALGRDVEPSCFDEDLRNYVDENIILASFVPFRTASRNKIKKPMMEFAREKYWNRLLPILQPDLIVTTGGDAFLGSKIY